MARVIRELGWVALCILGCAAFIGLVVAGEQIKARASARLTCNQFVKSLDLPSRDIPTECLQR